MILVAVLFHLKDVVNNKNDLLKLLKFLSLDSSKVHLLLIQCYYRRKLKLN